MIMTEKGLNLDPISIVDIIQHRNERFTQTFFVLDRAPEFVYERIGNSLVAEDSGFFNFYYYNPPSQGFKAFAGREFTIKMKDEDDIEAKGQWWDGMPADYSGLVYQHGVGTIKGLNDCNVFSSCYVDKEVVSYWLANNDPSNNYNKYCVRNKDYGMHKIVSKWGD